MNYYGATCAAVHPWATTAAIATTAAVTGAAVANANAANANAAAANANANAAAASSNAYNAGYNAGATTATTAVVAAPVAYSMGQIVAAQSRARPTICVAITGSPLPTARTEFTIKLSPLRKQNLEVRS